MLYTSLTVLIIFLTVLIGLLILSTVSSLIIKLISSISYWFVSRKVIEDETEEDEEFSNGLYNVKAFRERMKGMMDEDGLYDVYENPFKKTNFTGVEIITDSREMDIDKRIK